MSTLIDEYYNYDYWDHYILVEYYTFFIRSLLKYSTDLFLLDK